MSEHDNGWEFAKRLSDALLKVRPLGGSEMFVKRNNNYYADPDYCGQMIDEMRASLDQEIRTRIRMERALEQIEHASRKDSLTDHERIQSVRTVACAMLSRVGTVGEKS